MQTRLRLQNKQIIFPNRCPQHPEQHATSSICVSSALPKFEAVHLRKEGTFFSYEEALKVPVCKVCFNRYSFMKKLSRFLIIVGSVILLALFLILYFNSPALDEDSYLASIIIMTSIPSLTIGMAISFFANRLSGVLPIYSGIKGFDISIRSNDKYIREFMNLNECKEKAFTDL